MSDKLRAEVMGALLDLRLVDEADVVRWADAVVAAHERPDQAILAIAVESLGARIVAPDLMRALARVAGEANPLETTHAVLGVIARRLEHDPAFAQRAENAVFRVVARVDPVTSPSGAELGISDDAQRSRFIEDVQRELSPDLDMEQWHRVLLEFLSPYLPSAIDVPID